MNLSQLEQIRLLTTRAGQLGRRNEGQLLTPDTQFGQSTSRSREPVSIPGESAYQLAVRLELYSGPEDGFIQWLRQDLDPRSLVSTNPDNELEVDTQGLLYAPPPEVETRDW